VAHLRDAVAEVKELLNIMDNQAICIYDDVCLSVLSASMSTLLTSKQKFCIIGIQSMSSYLGTILSSAQSNVIQLESEMSSFESRLYTG